MYSNYNDNKKKKFLLKEYIENQKSFSEIARQVGTYANKIMPDVDMTSEYIDEDGEKKEFTVPMTVQFLWPTINL